jgi:Phospholipase_D-nuclease N-terminal
MDLVAKVSARDVPWAALAPVLAILLAFLVYCLWDVSRSHVRYLPKWAWVLICLVSVPFGGIVYLIVGREPR